MQAATARNRYETRKLTVTRRNRTEDRNAPSTPSALNAADEDQRTRKAHRVDPMQRNKTPGRDTSRRKRPRQIDVTALRAKRPRSARDEEPDELRITFDSNARNDE